MFALRAEKQKFISWLGRQGAEVLTPTNPYEALRFRARGSVHIVYEGRRGLTVPEFVRQCWEAFDRNGHMDMGIAKQARTPAAKLRAAVMQRDGRACFFCTKDMENDDITLEHLVAIGKGGPDHLDNCVLAHEACNRKADNLPLIDKIKMREKAMLTRPIEIIEEFVDIVRESDGVLGWIGGEESAWDDFEAPAKAKAFMGTPMVEALIKGAPCP